MSFKKQTSKLGSSYQIPVDLDAVLDEVLGAREKKSGVFGSSKGNKSKSKRKIRPNEPTNTELAKLLGNRTRALMAFEESGFDPNSFISTYLAQLSEKAIDNARRDLGALLATCTEEVESVVQQHHQRFLQACAGVEALEDQVALLRNYTNGLTALVTSLKSVLTVKTEWPASAGSRARTSWHGTGSPSFPSSPVAAAGALMPDSLGGSNPIQQIEADMELMLQELDLAAAARDLPSAVSWLRVAESVGQLLDRDAACLVMEVPDFPGWKHSYDAAVGLRKHRLVAALQRQLADGNASEVEIRAASHALIDLVGDATALQAMLHCYSHKVQLSQALLLKQHAAGSDPDSLEFAGGLVQRTLVLVAAAADDLVAIFGVSQREPASLFTVWAARQTRHVASILLRHVLCAAAAASTGLHTTVQVVAMCQVLCAMLEETHAISLTAILMTELWPSVEGALRRHLKRFTDELRMAATEEINSLVLGASSAEGSSGTAAVQVPSQLVTCSTLVKEVSFLAEMLGPIATPKLAVTFKTALTDMFSAATQTISFTLRSHIEESTVNATRLAPLLPGIMEVLAGLIEDQLPEAVTPFAVQAGPVVDVRKMDRALQALYKECSGSSRASRTAAAQQRVEAACSADLAALEDTALLGSKAAGEDI